MDFAADAALGKLGICPQCGNVFEALSERRDTKRYCSATCQANAKSTRQYRRRKIRKLAEELGRKPTLEEAQNAEWNFVVTEELMDAALTPPFNQEHLNTIKIDPEVGHAVLPAEWDADEDAVYDEL